MGIIVKLNRTQKYKRKKYSYQKLNGEGDGNVCILLFSAFKARDQKA